MADLLGSLNFGSMFSGLGNIKDLATTLLVSGIVLMVVGTGIFIVYKWIKNKAFFTIPITLTILNDNGMIQKERHDLMGGSFFNHGLKDFKIKTPKKMKPFLLGYVPDFSLTNYVDGRLHFITSGDQTVWQQVESFWVLRENHKENDKVFAYDLICKPIPRETKQTAVNAIKNWRDTIEKSKLTAWGIAIGAFVIMVIAHLVSLFIQTRIRCPVPTG